MSHPPIALSCGEPAGIGPEIAAKAWAALGAHLAVAGAPASPLDLPADSAMPVTEVLVGAVPS